MEIKNNALPIIGLIGTGWVGSSYLRAFKSQGFNPICYSLEPEYKGNKDAIKECDVVFIAVPTPTISSGFDDTILRDVVKLVGNGKIAVIKSTVIPGTTDSIQAENPEIIVIHSPEFLSVLTADYDAKNPKRNIIGLPKMSSNYNDAASYLLKLLPPAPFTTICSAVEAEVIKYAHNCGGYLRVVFHNILYDVCKEMGGEWETIKNAISADPDNINSYLNPVHKNGRGAGGPCFIKDFSAFNKFYNSFGDTLGSNFLTAVEQKNISLLKASGKDLNILSSIFHDEEL